MTEHKEPLIPLGVKPSINFEKQESNAFPMMRRSTDSRVFSGKAIIDSPITKTEIERLREDLQKKEATLKVQFNQIRKEHISYVTEMELETLAKDMKITELQNRIEEACKEIANKEQTIRFQKELIAKKNEKIEEQKKEFTKTIARVVHDLKSPLTSVKTAADILEEYSFTDDVKTLLRIITAAATDLTGMVEDILLTNKLTHNAVVLDKKTYSLTSQINDLVEQNREYAKKMKRSVSFRSAGEVIIHADKLKIKRAIGNLLSNALKYGKNKVKISLYETLDEIFLSISDDGNGLDEEVRKKVFSNNEMTTTDLINGNGFGLTNAKRLIEMHGGTLDLAENDNKSTIFMIKFPKK